MKFAMIKICQKCGVRNESPVMTTDEVLDLAVGLGSVRFMTQLAGRDTFCDDVACAACEGKEVSQPDRDGIDRAYSINVRPEGR